MCPAQVKVYCHEGEGEGTEHLDSMDLLDVKSELERDAEKSEVRILQCMYTSLMLSLWCTDRQKHSVLRDVWKNALS